MAEQQTPGDADHMLPYYVYELRDPRDNAVFYVGKGTRDRVDFHDEGDESDKQRRIAAIKASGHEVTRVIVARVETEAEAFAVETVLIKWTYGFDHLTNAIHGHRASFVRPSTEWRQQAYTTMPGIDVERVPRGLREGTYTQKQRDQILDNGIVEKLWAIYDYLRGVFGDDPRHQIHEPDLSVAQDPHLLVSGFSPALRLMIRLPLSGRVMRLQAIPARGGSRQALTEAMQWLDPAPAINNGTCYRCYAPIGPSVSREVDRKGQLAIDDLEGLGRAIRRITDPFRRRRG
ncbi:GIY-YIG nuclease family protein [Spiribacter vilamensis]|uniref:GIY-YIG domain-containing protein n=1 Tax=Spiribacter vilamensis TaxID=531306 RepID=A0A4V2GIZ4_9GAMM|nr:GIY-YIG nuclease family protein [Spiribacter vilamensis]RZU98275.1 hypothetical protein EV698_0519 [Spiribacter vilamensis]TVO60831.1 GIY-YIG nuclease family protein [Spiribacter vilamensis]